MNAYPLPASLPQIIGLSHVGLKASDIDRSCAFYREFLGFSEQCRLNYLTTGGLMLVCFKVSEEQWIEVFTGLMPGENRMHQVAFRVDDAEKIRACFGEHGVEVPTTTPKGQMGNFNFVVSDPSGQNIEFVQHLPSGSTERDRGKFLPSTRISARIRHARIAVKDLGQTESFYSVLGLAPAETRRTEPALSVRRTTATGDFVELVCEANAEAQFSLEVADVEAATEKLELNSYRSRYPRSLAWQVGNDGRRFLDLFDPDGTCVRLTEPQFGEGRPTSFSATMFSKV